MICSELKICVTNSSFEGLAMMFLGRCVVVTAGFLTLLPEKEFTGKSECTVTLWVIYRIISSLPSHDLAFLPFRPGERSFNFRIATLSSEGTSKLRLWNNMGIYYFLDKYELCCRWIWLGRLSLWCSLYFKSC